MVFVQGTRGPEKARIQAAMEEQGLTLLRDKQEALAHARSTGRVVLCDISLGDNAVTVTLGQANIKDFTTQTRWQFGDNLSPEERAKAIRDGFPDLTREFRLTTHELGLELIDEPARITIPLQAGEDGSPHLRVVAVR